MATVDDSLRLSIEISDPDKIGLWYKNGVAITPNDATKIEVIAFEKKQLINFTNFLFDKSLNGKHELLIPNAKLEDAGVYSFVIGDNKWDANVDVKGLFY